jgi:hypothetical protein
VAEMLEPIVPHWQETLHEVEAAVEQCLHALNQYEAAFAQVLIHQGVGSALPDRVSLRLAEIEPGWNQPLHVAERSTAEVEQLLLEQEERWHRWQERFQAWQNVLEQLGEAREAEGRPGETPRKS